ncbi:MAG: SDR family NAD(P)-dependent oxidoreductase [Clostridiales bacterium]|nr:SDR family NAD(P)-dependent oxidoreductase [Clostridiales bacterium]
MKTVVVTGATSGIGFAVCAELLMRGCRVIGLGHSKKNCRAAREKLLLINPAYDVTYFWGDLMQQTEVVRLAGRIKSDLLRNNGGELAALVNNVGCVRSWYMTTGEGYEQQFALNHLSGFLLTHELFGPLVKGGGVILFTSSGSHKLMKMNWQDLMFQRRYRPLYAYKQSKLCNMLTAFELNSRYAGQGIRAYGINPGLVRTEIGSKNTGKLVDFVWKQRSRHGVDPSVPARVYGDMICTGQKAEGLYHGAGGLMKHSGEVNRKNAVKLFEISESLCHIRFGVSEECLS